MIPTNDPPLTTLPPPREAILYPDCDGQPMSDNTLQFRWIMTLQGGLDALFRADPHVFVAGDLLWYPVEGSPTIRAAPDAMVAFGRPKGYRGSYMQWKEAGVAPQVVFEVTSPGNRHGDMVRKFRFYERYGVEGVLPLRPRPRPPGRLAPRRGGTPGDPRAERLDQPPPRHPASTSPTPSCASSGPTASPSPPTWSWRSSATS